MNDEFETEIAILEAWILALIRELDMMIEEEEIAKKALKS